MEVEATPTTAVSSSGGAQLPPPGPPAKKKRALPGMPDPDAEVIALSPKTLLATNRFVCEICNKGFQRDQNLQLHRRGHNLPWKLRQRSGKEVRKRVYVCPEPSCVHHDPARALGDLTGIKKHFCRKHGEKKWKCDRCSKKYAVQSDWKAHVKTCGSREYRCDCGTLFSRRDSFITHRAFCDALAEESAKARAAPPPEEEEDGSSAAVGPPPAPPPHQTPVPAAPAPLRQQPPPPPPPPAAAPAPQHSEQHNERETTAAEPVQFAPPPPVTVPSQASVTAANVSPSSSTSVAVTSQSLLGGMFAPSSVVSTPQFPDLGGGVGRPERALPAKPPSLCLATDASSSIFSAPVAADRQQFAPPPPPSPSPHMSATALLQKAAQMGATSSSSSFLRGLGLDVSTSSPGASSSGQQHHQEAMQVSVPDTSLQQWPPRLEPEPAPMLSAGLGLGLPYDSTGAPVGFPELMMSHSSLFSAKPATLDFLGLGMSPTGASASRGLSAFIQPIGGPVGMAGTSASGAETFGAGRGAQATSWERNPSSSPIL
ncbi:zinc finger protein GAI-ASSOCIATED FACTOR 1-like isoform X2 [Phragmites australis]|uniref:zinc finger protein GAI-ASSOCIATED FACTOR 1-like isoform X2 n=1 Tax=Phragmites australis TaxID=29695 RepID=UPI002D7A403E|nr:zinc finger protein GAI-ASSOCIATED FACTOR 1-like isoform X2 [Phragmites australis]